MGGKWIIRLRKGLASRCWENLILAMLGEQFMVGEEICGAVVSVRFQVQTHKRAHCFCLLWICCMWLYVSLRYLIPRRTSSPSGTKRRVTSRPLPASETHCAESSTCRPTPSWSTRHTQTALSMYVSTFYYFSLIFLSHTLYMFACSQTLHGCKVYIHFMKHLKTDYKILSYLMSKLQNGKLCFN